MPDSQQRDQIQHEAELLVGGGEITVAANGTDHRDGLALELAECFFQGIWCLALDFDAVEVLFEATFFGLCLKNRPTSKSKTHSLPSSVPVSVNAAK